MSVCIWATPCNQNDILTSAQNVYWHHDWQYIFLAYITRDRKSLGQKKMMWTTRSYQHKTNTRVWMCKQKQFVLRHNNNNDNNSEERISSHTLFSNLFTYLWMCLCVCSHNNNRTFFLRIINIYHLSERSITVFSRTIESWSKEAPTTIKLSCYTVIYL